MRPFHLYGLFLLAVCAGMLGAWIWWLQLDHDPCRGAGKTSEIIECYTKHAHTIARTQNVNAALQFIERTLFKNSNWSVAHLVMHTIGQDAYREQASVANALALVPKHVVLQNGSSISEGWYDGYKHGVLQEFFFTHAGASLAQAVPEACGDSETSTSIADPRNDAYFEGEKCFHAVGHALMYTYENDVAFSAGQCRTLEHERYRYWCLFGVYMENSYLYLPSYAPGAPRPDVAGDSMAGLCETIANKEERAICVKFVGRSYLAVKAPDTQGAFDVCRYFGKDGASCIANTVRIYLMPAFQGDVERMVSNCKLLNSAEEQQICINAFAYGFSNGGGGFENRNDQIRFCEAAEQTLGKLCEPVVDWGVYI